MGLDWGWNLVFHKQISGATERFSLGLEERSGDVARILPLSSGKLQVRFLLPLAYRGRRNYSRLGLLSLSDHHEKFPHFIKSQASVIWYFIQRISFNAWKTRNCPQNTILFSWNYIVFHLLLRCTEQFYLIKRKWLRDCSNPENSAELSFP